jgi:hypothetical protein
MFVRFRKVSNAGIKPEHVADGAAERECRRVTGYLCGGGHCYAKPRCRWALRAGDLRLEPYRLKVTLLANTRINGRVKQELVATLGSIDTILLDYFFKDIPPEVAAGLRCADWRYRSLGARTAFWQDVLERMGQIGDNRLSADERKAIRRAIHQVVPWVMEAECKELALLNARREFKSIQQMHAWREEHVKRNEEMIADYTKRLAEDRESSAKCAEAMFYAGKQIADLEAKG